MQTMENSAFRHSYHSKERRKRQEISEWYGEKEIDGKLCRKKIFEPVGI